jgi:uncharacterized protein (TIGR03435 family)
VVGQTPLFRPLRMHPIVVVQWVALMLPGWLTPVCGAQALTSSSPTFTVATIKPSDPDRTEGEGDMGFTPSGSFDAKSHSLKELIEFVQDFAYFHVDQRIVGGPKWLGSAKFDIEAKCDEKTAREFGKLPLKQQIHVEQEMIGALLADRFKLRTHHEMRRLPVYVLLQVKSGSKMKPSAQAKKEEPGDADGPPGNWKGEGVSMAEFARDLSALPEVGGRIVVDRTALNERFDFTLKWTPDPTFGATPPTSDIESPSLLTALREQLGLKLEMAKEPVDVIVIDSAELPTLN